MNADIKNNKETNDIENKNPESSFGRKLKYGSVAMVFTVVFVAVIFLVNVVATSINNVRPLMIDMTKEQIYGITDASRELLKDVTAPVEIVFFMDIDMYEKTVSGGKMIVNCIKTFENEYDNITIKTVDIIKNPGAQAEYKTSDLSQLKTTSIAVKSGNTPKLLAYSAFYVIAESTGEAMGFAGEKTLTAAILQVTNTDSPTVYFTTGHGESDLTENALSDLFKQNGFLVKQIDLTTEDIDPEAKIVVICNPRRDFLGTDPNNLGIKSEIDKIGTFLNNFGNLMYFTSRDLQVATPELDDLLKEYNIEIEHNNLIVDMSNAFDQDGVYLSGQYYVSEGAGDELTASIRSLPTAPRSVVPYAEPIKILEATTEVNVSPVLKSSSSSVKYNMTDGNAVAQGEFNLLVLAQKTQYVDNEPKSSLVLACGSVDFLNNNALMSNTYGNPDILLNAMRIMANRKVTTDVKWKEFDSTALSMTLEEQNMWSLICMLVLPLLSSAAGVAVWLKRRHS